MEQIEKKGVILKPGKEKALLNRHHWIFSGAIAKSPQYADGDILPVFSSEGAHLGSAYFNHKTQIRGRMVAFGEEDPKSAIEKNLLAACKMRQKLFDQNTNAYRLINAEGDLLPGLIADLYDNVLVLQISTKGMQKLQETVVDFFQRHLDLKAIIEKSESPALKEEGLKPSVRYLFGQEQKEIEIKENNLKYLVQPLEGQKTGFFLDQREMRAWVRELAAGKKLLNCFSYTGGFTVSALAGGALKADSVDISEKAIDLARQNVSINGLRSEVSQFHAEDVFQFLRNSSLNYDFVILDPPAFAKRAKDVIAGCRGYKDINRVAMQKMPKGSLLLSCSCSYYVDEDLFQKVLFQAAVEAGRSVKIIGHHRQAKDHPINLCHPEMDYLKSFLLYIE